MDEDYCLCTGCAGINAVNAYPPKKVEVPKMSKSEFADNVINYAIDLAMDELKMIHNDGDSAKRAKFYRKAGLELLAMAAQMDAEITFGV